jgi:hypothetical protein
VGRRKKFKIKKHLSIRIEKLLNTKLRKLSKKS